MIHALLLMLLLLAAPAWADFTFTPVLSATYATGYPFGDAFTHGLTVTTADFTAFTSNAGTEKGTYQGIFYCNFDGIPCGDGLFFQHTDVRTSSFTGGPIAMVCLLSPCPLGEVPVGMNGETTFHDPTSGVGVTFFFEDDAGVGLNVLTGRGPLIVHADFGAAIQNPEPSTWLLVLTGLGVLLMARSSMLSRRRS